MRKSIIITILVGFVSLAAIIAIHFIIATNIPEQRENVIILDKRIMKGASGVDYNDRNKCLITFQFFDGSAKELEIFPSWFTTDIFSTERKRKRTYDSIYIGDTGVLIYKQVKNNKYFIRFEKDSLSEK